MELTAIFQIGSLGDSIVSIPSLRAVRDLIPECSEYILVSRFESSAYVAPANVFDMVWRPRRNVTYRGQGSAIRRYSSVASVVGQLRRYRPRYCVYLMPSARTPGQVQRDTSFFRAAGVRELVGFRSMTPQELEEKAAGGVFHREAYLRLKRLLGIRAEEVFQQYASPPLIKAPSDTVAGTRQWLMDKGVDLEKPLVAVCPFTNVRAREWPLANVGALARRLARFTQVILLGGDKDRGAAKALVPSVSSLVDGCGAFSVEQSAALLSLCRLAVVMDSGPMHLASAVGTPSVVVYSRYDRLGRWLPLGTGHTILYREIPCAGCREPLCPVAGHPCMSDIQVTDVFDAVMRKLHGGECNSGEPTGTRILNL